MLRIIWKNEQRSDASSVELYNLFMGLFLFFVSTILSKKTDKKKKYITIFKINCSISRRERLEKVLIK